MKKEDIEKAAGETSERIANIAYAGGGHIGQDDLEEAFIIGSNWRINSVWHDATEVPETLKLLLVENKEGSISLCRILAKKSNTESWLRWAYIEDLLPNMDE